MQLKLWARLGDETPGFHECTAMHSFLLLPELGVLHWYRAGVKQMDVCRSCHVQLITRATPNLYRLAQ